MNEEINQLYQENIRLSQRIRRNLDISRIACSILVLALMGVCLKLSLERQISDMNYSSIAMEHKYALSQQRKELASLKEEHQKTLNYFNETLRAYEAAYQKEHGPGTQPPGVLRNVPLPLIRRTGAPRIMGFR